MKEFKDKGIERAKDHVKKVNTKELINYMLPNCDVTVGEERCKEVFEDLHQPFIASDINDLIKQANDIYNARIK